MPGPSWRKGEHDGWEQARRRTRGAFARRGRGAKRRAGPPLLRSEGGVAAQPPERGGRGEGPANEEQGEVPRLSKRHVGAEGERRLTEAGFLPEESGAHKRRFRDPETGRAMPPGTALDEAERGEERELEGAGWERVEVEGETYWSKPDSGRLYPRGAAYDVQKRGESEAQ